LHGIPITIKDLTATAGLRTTYGSPLYERHIPTTDDFCVARLKAAGAIIIGKTSVPPFGFGTGTDNPLIGITRNPYDPSRSCGDSSGGAAVAVATGMGYLAQGNDLGGSVRTPASFCGIVGLRPAIGRIPRAPKPLLWESLISDGCMTRTVEDAALMLAAMAGFDPRDPVAIAQPQWHPSLFRHDTPAPPLRVGYSPNLGIALVDSEVERGFLQAITTMQAAGLSVQPAHPTCINVQSTFETLRAALIYQLYGHYLSTHPETLSPTMRWEIEQGVDLSADAYLNAETPRGRLYRQFLNFFQTYDILAIPTASVPPFPVEQATVTAINGHPLRNPIDDLTLTYTISLTGLPALSIPCGQTATGLPLGMQLVGKPHGEAELLQFAYFLQEQLHFRHRWPLAGH
ncbi:MAG TPA: amidase, partial [Chroococcidiopsis sp.]